MLHLFNPDEDKLGRLQLPETIEGEIIGRIKSIYSHWSYVLTLPKVLEGKDSAHRPVSYRYLLIGPFASTKNDGIEDFLDRELLKREKVVVWVSGVQDLSALPDKLTVEDSNSARCPNICSAEGSLK